MSDSAAHIARPRVERVSEGNPSVLLLTPLAYDARIWGRFGQVLGAECGLQIAAWGGHGPGGNKADRAKVDEVADVDRLTPQLGEVDVVVAARSDASAGVTLALRGSVRGLVLLDPELYVPLPEVTIDDFDSRLEAALGRVPDAAVEAFRAGDAVAFADQVTNRSTLALGEADREAVREVLATNVDALFARAAQSRRPPGREWPDLLPNLRVPVLGIARVIPGNDLPERHLRALVARCGEGHFRGVESVTDYPWLERPEELARAILEFAADLEA